MKKTFQLTRANKHPDRVLDAIKHEIRQYLRRERRKPLPAGADFWDFDCQVGATAEQAQAVHLGDLLKRVDALAQEGLTAFYLQLIAQPGVRRPRTEAATSDELAHTDRGDAADPT